VDAISLTKGKIKPYRKEKSRAIWSDRKLDGRAEKMKRKQNPNPSPGQGKRGTRFSWTWGLSASGK